MPAGIDRPASSTDPSAPVWDPKSAHWWIGETTSAGWRPTAWWDGTRWVPLEATPSSSPTSSGPGAGERRSSSYVDSAGTSSSYHLLGRPAQPQGLVVYLDGDGMYGHRNYTSTWALGGSRGVVAQAAARGYATLSILTPDRRGTATFWEDGRVNAAYVAELTSRIRTELGVQKTWFVGYSGGSQLITQYLLPGHADLMADGGGAVITGGGGRPYRGGQQSLSTVSAATKAGFPMLWYTGSLDDGRGTDDGYDALADAKSGHAWYAERGFRATRQQPAGLDHSDLGTRFGTVLAGQLDAHRAQVTRARR